MLTEKEIEEIKKQLLNQIESWPENKRGEARSQIQSMSNEEIEDLVVRNNLIKNKEIISNSKSPFRLIIEGKIPSYKIGENKDAIAVLEINPFSKGHTIIIPKKEAKNGKFLKNILSFAKKISKIIKDKLHPESINIEKIEILNESIINIIPIYKNSILEKKQASEEELLSLQKVLLGKEVKEKNKETPKKAAAKILPKVAKRIP